MAAPPGTQAPAVTDSEWKNLPFFPAGFHQVQVATLCTRVICQSGHAEPLENERRAVAFVACTVLARGPAERSHSHSATEFTERTQFRATRKDSRACDPASAVRVARRTPYRTNPYRFSCWPTTTPNRTLHKRGLATARTSRDEDAALRAGVWPLEKTNPFWKPAKTKQSHCFPPSDYFRKNPIPRNSQEFKSLRCCAGSTSRVPHTIPNEPNSSRRRPATRKIEPN